MTPERLIKTPTWNYIRKGARGAPTVLLLHAVGLDLTFWDKQIDALREKFDVIALDFPGHGLSPAVPEDWSFVKACDEVVEFMDQVGINAAHVVGLSFGGMVAQQMALSHPARMISMTLIASAATFPPEVRANMIEHAAAIETSGMRAVLPLLQYWIATETGQGRPDIIDRMAKSLLRMDPAAYGTIWRMIACFDVLDQLHGFDLPTHIIVGDRDLNTPASFAFAIVDTIPRGSVAVLPRGSHLLPLDAPQAVSAAVNDWLRSV